MENKIMIGKAKYYILRLSEILFYFYLFTMLSFGRAFAILRWKTPLINIFVTEAILFLSLPLIILNIRKVLKLPKIFLLVASLYFFYGSFHLFLGMQKGNFYTLRNIVFFVYVLFLILSFLIFSEEKGRKIFLIILLTSNIVNIIAGRFFVFGFYPAIAIGNFFSDIRSFNLGLYYGITVSFLFSLLSGSTLIKKRGMNYFIYILLSINFYMIFLLGGRGIWLAFAVLMFFLFLMSKLIFVKTFLRLLPISCLVFLSLFLLDFKLSEIQPQQKHVISKIKTLPVVLKIFTGSSKATTQEYSQLSKESQDKATTQEYSQPSKEEAKKLTNEKNTLFDVLINRADELRNAEKEIIKNEVTSSLYWRLKIFKQTIDFGIISPIWGRGFGVFPGYKVYHNLPIILPSGTLDIDSGVVPAHNHLASIFYKLGFFGLSLFMFLNIYVFLLSLKLIKRADSEFKKFYLIGALGSILFWHVSALFFGVIDSPPTSIFLWILMGIIFGVLDTNAKIKFL